MARPAITLIVSALLFTTTACAAGPTYLSSGVKIGEVTHDSAIIWTRLASAKTFDQDVFALPGAPGKVQLKCQGAGQTLTYGAPVRTDHDFTRQFKLKNLEPATTYQYTVQSPSGDTVNGSFTTAPAPDQPAKVSFTVTTGHAYRSIDEPGKGQKIYPAMGKLKPSFFVHTGDIVYYDNDPPNANTVALARAHWHRLYSLPYQREFHRLVPSYFIKDDHDTLKNDCWPGQTYGEVTFAQGQAIFLEQVPMGEKTYRTIRWGKDMQIWLPEGRDFRSPNTMEDGPDKTIWGKQQIEWFKQTVEASDATFKILISPTPVVGPDRAKGKNDNHANAAFQTEGDWLRTYLADHNMIVCNGDRHWQYHTVDDVTGLEEFCSGPSTDKHAGGWNPNNKTAEHRFLRVKGGFLAVTINRINGQPTAIFRHHDVDGNVVNEVKITR